MPFAVDNITYETQKLLAVYRSVSDTIGPHEQDFYDMLQLVQRAQESAADALMTLPENMKASADYLEDFLNSHPELDEGSDNPPVNQRIRTR